MLNRIDLADIHAPKRLAGMVLDMLGPLDGAVPVVQVAEALDISAVRIDRFDGFEGMLLTDRRRTDGVILANTQRGDRRARFTVAHELGHFLMERHVPSDEGGFRCMAFDMRERRKAERHYRQEAEANRFAIELLAPAHLAVPLLVDPPDLRQALSMRDLLDLSLEACVRRQIELADQTLAAIWSHEGRVRYPVRSRAFPFLTCQKGHALPKGTAGFRAIQKGERGITRMTETSAIAWTNNPEIEIWEQTRIGKNRHAVTLLWADMPDEGDDNGESHRELGMPTFR